MTQALWITGVCLVGALALLIDQRRRMLRMRAGWDRVCRLHWEVRKELQDHIGGLECRCLVLQGKIAELTNELKQAEARYSALQRAANGTEVID